MTCEQFTEQLGEAVDGTLPPHIQKEMDAHCSGCEACRDLLNDLKDIRAAAAELERFTPPPAVWAAIAAKTAPPPRRQSWVGLAAAAALLIMAGTAGWLALGPGRSPGSESAVELARNAASELHLAEQHYENAITALERLTVSTDTALDPAVAAEIAQSLQSIDRAIADSREALKAEPGSFVAQTSLLEALRMKVALLQETVSLMNATS
jgi:hypothetical protein